MIMKKLIIAFFLVCLCVSTGQAQKKLSEKDRAKLTPEQRIVYDNSFRKKERNGKVPSLKKKVKREKKEDRLSRKLRASKKHKLKKR